MSLPVLVILVVVGIAAIVLAVHLTGGTRTAVLADEAAARARFAVDHPREQPAGVRLTLSRDAAFLDLDGSRTGIVQSFGGHFLTRVVSAADVARLERVASASLVIVTSDFTWRGGRFDFASAADADAVAARLALPALEQRRTA
ncbi:hypothetical protein [Aquibium microcysteis]|uniref:hypothetical protein n=1 Tax=Aquibium microcysteis TaxID=675281 RepID=UPI00165D1193|nr:hypothetical protein [Aquibium microcysteis]